MKKITLKGFALAAMSLFSIGASAQFSTAVEQYATTDYSAVLASFSFTDVATQLGTDTATLARQIDALYSEAGGATLTYGVQDPNDATVVKTDGNADGPGSYWMAADCSVSSWGADGCAFYNSSLRYNCEENTLSIPLGQFPDYFKEGGEVKPTFQINYNNKVATFAVTFTINALPTVEAAPQLRTALEIVGNATCGSEQEPKGDYTASAVSVDVPGLKAALGLSNLDDAALNASLAGMVYIQQVESEYGLLTDTLLCLNTNGGWTKEAVNNEGEASGKVGFFNWGAGDAMYLDTWKIEGETLTFNVGQYPGSLKAEQNLTAVFYICNGAKAYEVSYTLTTITPTYTSLSDMTKVGEATVEVSANPDNNYKSTSFSVDTDAIAQALGVSTVSLQALAEPNSLSSSSTANNGGWWLTAEGYVTSWSTASGGSVFFIEPAENNNFSKLNIGQMPNMCQIGDTLIANLYAVNNGQYYEVKVVYTIKEKEDEGQDQFEVVATRNVTIQQTQNGEYAWSTGVTVANAQINEALGITASDVVLYALNVDSIAQQTGKAYTEDYTCTPFPGFWLTQDGKRTTWGADSYWGISTANETGNDGITFSGIQFPGNTNVGDTFNGKFYLVNLNTKKMMQINLSYQIVDAVEDINEVGNINITVPVSTDDSEKDFNKLGEIAEALGVEDLLSGYYLRGIAANGQYSEAVAASTGLTFSADGACAEMQNIGIYFEDGKIATYSNEDIAEDFNANAVICFENDGKRYVINVRMMSKTAYEALASKGDVNGDGQVNINDVNDITAVICGGEANAKADINGDGKVDIKDINEVISIICGE